MRILKRIIPKEVIPFSGGYDIETSKGDVSQQGNIVEVKIDSILPKEAVKLTIKGKVSA